MIKVLIVDDSAFMRSALTRMLKDDPDIEVVGVARDGEEGLAQVKALNPDLITLDIEMPRMDGLTMLAHLMKTTPKPVIMVSSLTQEGAESTLKAMDLGALDFIPKIKNAGMVLDDMQRDICNKVKAVARRGRFMRPPPAYSPSPMLVARPPLSRNPAPATLPERTSPFLFTPRPVREEPKPPVMVSLRPGRPLRDMVAIGVSTGGPPAVQRVLAALPADFPACIFIAQHMPASFTNAFAKRLDSICKIQVKEAESGDKIAPGIAYVAPGGQHLRVDMRGPLPYLTVTRQPEEALYKPSANVLMESVGASIGRRCVGMIMTGMGSDGTEGMKVLKQKGGWVIAQNEASCVVYGMPKSVVDAGLADEVVELDALAETMVAALYR